MNFALYIVNIIKVSLNSVVFAEFRQVFAVFRQVYVFQN
jgi:hypothetical protein